MAVKEVITERVEVIKERHYEGSFSVEAYTNIRMVLEQNVIKFHLMLNGDRQSRYTDRMKVDFDRAKKAYADFTGLDAEDVIDGYYARRVARAKGNPFEF